MILKLILAIVTLGISVFAWWTKKTSDDQRKKDETDKEIEKADDAVSLLRIFDKLRRRK